MKKYDPKNSNAFGVLPPTDPQRARDSSNKESHSVAAGRWAYKDFGAFVQDLKQLKEFSERVTGALHAMHQEFEFFTQVNELILKTYKQQQVNNTDQGEPEKPMSNPQNQKPKSADGERSSGLKSAASDSDDAKTLPPRSPKDFLH